MNPEIIEKIKAHYYHAREKHPYFCDKLTYANDFIADYALSMSRKILKESTEKENVTFGNVLTCEMSEAIKEIVNNNIERAIEELLDMIAVCLRGIDVLEGRQVLGDPEKKGDAK